MKIEKRLESLLSISPPEIDTIAENAEVPKSKFYFLCHINSVQSSQELLSVMLKIVASCAVYFKNKFYVRIVKVYHTDLRTNVRN